MYRLKDIQQALMHLVGWEQALDPRKSIERGITESESGLYFQGAHPLLTLENMRSIMPDDWLYTYPEWNNLETYHAGDKVSHNGMAWIAKQESTGCEPTASDFNGDYSREDYGNPCWLPFNMLSDFLSRLTENGINTTVLTFIQMKQLQKETRNLLDRRTFFDGAGRLKATIMNTHKLVGFEIIPVRAMGVTAKIEKVGLQMTGATGTVKLYLFHASQVLPVKTFEVSFTLTSGGFQWFTLEDCYLPYMGDGNNAGGSWFLCYDQDELPFGMEAINMSKDWSREPCGTCNMGSLQGWRELTKYLQISPFAHNAPEGFSDSPEMWDIATNLYTHTMNYGLNCEVSVGCDLTDFIIEQRQIFASVLQKQVAATALRTLAMNPDVRVNRNQSNASRTDILYEIDGNTSGRPGGLGYDLKKAYEALSLDTQGLDRVCLSCNNHGVKYRTA